MINFTIHFFDKVHNLYSKKRAKKDNLENHFTFYSIKFKADYNWVKLVIHYQNLFYQLQYTGQHLLQRFIHYISLDEEAMKETSLTPHLKLNLNPVSKLL